MPEEARLSINDLIVKACAMALQKHPAFNVTLDGDQMTQPGEQNVCIAIALDEGLIAPAILDAGRKSLSQIAAESKDLVARAKGGSLRPDEITAGTFSITNLGAYGIETLIGIIQPPQTAILGVGSVMPHAAVHDGAIAVREMMKVALSADHRITDGALGAVPRRDQALARITAAPRPLVGRLLLDEGDAVAFGIRDAAIVGPPGTSTAVRSRYRRALSRAPSMPRRSNTCMYSVTPGFSAAKMCPLSCSGSGPPMPAGTGMMAPSPIAQLNICE